MAAHTSSPYKRSETPASSVLPGTHSRPRFIFGTNADQVVMIGPKTNDRLAFTLAPALEIEFVCAERRFDVSPPIVDNESGGFNAQKLSQAPQDQWDMLTQAPTSHIVANLGGNPQNVALCFVGRDSSGADFRWRLIVRILG